MDNQEDESRAGGEHHGKQDDEVRLMAWLISREWMKKVYCLVIYSFPWSGFSS